MGLRAAVPGAGFSSVAGIETFFYQDSMKAK